jgi:hypothetical protein
MVKINFILSPETKESNKPAGDERNGDAALAEGAADR